VRLQARWPGSHFAWSVTEPVMTGLAKACSDSSYLILGPARPLPLVMLIAAEGGRAMLMEVFAGCQPAQASAAVRLLADPGLPAL
jgi:hypothetical protein